MKIRRIINGVPVDIELTKTEEFDIYFAKQKELDMDDVRNNDFFGKMEDWMSGTELVTREEWESDGIPAVAELYRKNIDNDDGWYNLLELAAEDVMYKMIQAKRERAVSA